MPRTKKQPQRLVTTGAGDNEGYESFEEPPPPPPKRRKVEKVENVVKTYAVYNYEPVELIAIAELLFLVKSENVINNSGRSLQIELQTREDGIETLSFSTKSHASIAETIVPMVTPPPRNCN
jgi:hypothetical protein